MGLFSSKSKSTATTTYTDSSRNQEFSTGDFLASDKNTIAGGDIYNEGLSEDMVSNIFAGINEQVDTILTGSKEQVNTILKNTDTIYKNAFNWVANAIGTQSENVAQVNSALTQAYNSEQATISSFKTYALYALVGFIAWSYFSKMR